MRSFFSLLSLSLTLFFLFTSCDAQVQALNVSISTTAPLRVVFFDFDQTLATSSVGDAVLERCDPLCLSYNAGACKCSVDNQALASFFQNMPGNREYVNGINGLGGFERVQRLFRTLTFLQRHNVQIRMLSTSWGKISPRGWANFLHTFLSLSTPSLAQFFPVENIIALRDPGEGLSADKGRAAAAYLSRNNFTSVHNGLLVDDSPTNIQKMQGNADWIQVYPRTGMSLNVMRVLEDRAVASQFTYSVDDSFPLRVAFFDFDKTLVKTSVGEEVTNLCDSQCLNYSAVSCNCNLASFLDIIPFSYVSEGLGGAARIRTLENAFIQLQQRGVSLQVLSTSWGLISSDNWRDFIARYFQIASPILGGFLTSNNIISLADPGEGISADKGAAAYTFLQRRGLNPHNGILVDDSPSNILRAQGKVDWLQVSPSEGVAADALNFLVSRAGKGTRPSSLLGTGRRLLARNKLANNGKIRYSLLVTRSLSYCGGAAPSEEILQDLRTPQPLPDWKLLFYRADAILQRREGEPKVAVSNQNGFVRVALDVLPSNSIYCVVEESKSRDLIVPPNDGCAKYDQNCLQKQHDTCDFVLTAENTTATLNFPTYCSWATPCINYTGPLPA